MFITNASVAVVLVTTLSQVIFLMGGHQSGGTTPTIRMLQFVFVFGLFSEQLWLFNGQVEDYTA